MVASAWCTTFEQTSAKPGAAEVPWLDCSGFGCPCLYLRGKARPTIHPPSLTHSKRKLGVVAVTGAVLLSAIAMLAAELTPSAGAAASRRAPRCATAQLVIWLNEVPGNGAAGSVFHQLAFTNLSRRTCTLRGFPRASAANLHGRRVGGFATREVGVKAHTVRLRPGDTAFAGLRIVEAQNFPHATCRPVTAAGLRVWPPGRHASKLVPFPFEACARASNPNLSVQAVKG